MMNGKVINIGICDDEPIIVNIVKEKCEYFFNSTDLIYNIACFTDGTDLLKCSEDFDLVFLDIEMPAMDGFEVAKRLKKQMKQCSIVILTSHDEYMKQGYVVKAFRYLTKPINNIEFHEAISSFVEEKVSSEYILLKISEKKQLLYVKIRDILYIESLGDTSAMTTVDSILTSHYTLKEWLEILDNSTFILSHRSVIINLRYVKDLGKFHVLLKNNKKLPVSVRRSRYTKEKYFDYLIDHAHYAGGE